MQAVPMELRMALGNKMLIGNGTSDPQGILNAECTISIAKETDQAAQTFLAENVVKMDARFQEFNPASCAWLMNRGLKTQLPLLNLAVGVGGALVYMPPQMGLTGPMPASLLGKPIRFCQYCKARGTAGDVMLVDMSQYLLGLKSGSGVKAASSIHVQFAAEETAFRFSLRCEGRPRMSAAVTPLNCVSGETLSPFVILAVRA
jgi:HK97 family phage major capsid protein